MRLINTSTLQLEEFTDDQAPSYAILSHTWGLDAEELSFHDVQDSILEKPGVGSSKLRGSCRKAEEDGLAYLWIDTCCINKASLVELTEAINSMFRWYRNASVCYAYLADVPPDDHPRREESSFQKSRWFRRGWTLQELLAPRRLVFYNSEWHCLGTKAQLSAVIESITGISSLFLRGVDDLHTASVAQRMSWAARRSTKRKEDLAYCLLGLFGITMPMLYGEGGDKAFFRLQEQIMRNTKDHSILAWGFGEEQPRARGVLAASPADFANSGHIVAREQPYFNSLEISSGSLRISLPLLATEAEITGLLNCGPEGDAGQVVGIPLSRVPSRGPDEYIRPRGRCSVLRPAPAPDFPHKKIYIQNYDGVGMRSSDKYFWMYEEDNFTDVDLELLDVLPLSSWHEDKAVFISTLGSDPTLVRLRYQKKVSYDFILILKFKQGAPNIEADCYIMIGSRGTPLTRLASMCDRIIGNASRMESASNGLVSLRLTVNPVARRHLGSIRLDTIPDPPRATFDGTDGLHKSFLRFWTEATLRLQKDSEALKSIDCCEKTHKLRRILGKAPLLWAFYHGDPGILQMFLNDRDVVATINSGTGTPLIAAAEKGLVEAVRIILAHSKANIDSKDREYGRSALSWASKNGHETIVRILLENGADVEARDGASRTALSYAAEKGYEGIERLLCKTGAATGDDITVWRFRETPGGYSGIIVSVAFLYDREIRIAVSKVPTIMWSQNMETGELQSTLEGRWLSMPLLAYSHDPVLTEPVLSKDFQDQFRGTSTGQLNRFFRGRVKDDIKSATFSHDFKLLASGSMYHYI